MNVKKYILIFLAVLIVGGAAAGIIYAVIHKTSSKSSNSNNANDNSSNSNDNNSNGDNTNSSNNPETTGTNGPTKPGATFLTWDKKVVDLTIKPDPRFKKSFYGMNYGPVNATYPSCGNTLGDVIEDVKVLSQLTNRLRLYGMDCNMANYTLMAIELLNLDMTIVPTIWVDINQTTYQRQYNDLFANLRQHGFKHIDGISVGNEVLFDQTFGSGVPTSQLFNDIADVRQKVRALPGAPKNLPVFTSDIGSNINDTVATVVDVVFANVHPYFAGVSVQEGTDWTFQYFEATDVPPAKKQNKQAVLSEVGWPSNGVSQQGAVPSLPNLQTFLSQFVCAANQKGYMYYYFETYDTPWKTMQFGLLEGSWGLFNPDRTMKSLTLPDCKPTASTFTGPSS